MRVVSFNINSVRARPHQLEHIHRVHAPTIIGLQETKVTDEDFPADLPQQLGYECIVHGQKTHYGVAILHAIEDAQPVTGFPWQEADAQRRFVAADCAMADGTRLHVINGYFPQGESRSHAVKFPGKARFYADVLRYLQTHAKPSEAVIVMGDLNVAPQDLDIGIGDDNRKRWLREGKCSFLPEEREWFQALLDWGLTDTWRHLHPEESDTFSWFDYRSRGFEREPRRGLRIDQILCSAPLLDRLTAAGIDYEARGMEKPSDHCPIWAEFES